MKRSTKLLISSAVLAVAGILFMAIGLGNGAHLSLSLNASGFHIRGLNPEEAVDLEDLHLEAFQNIDVQLNEADIQFIPAENYGVEIHYASKEDSPSYRVENGTLTLRDQSNNGFNWAIFNFDFEFWDQSKRNVVKIYYPKEAKFEKVKSSTKYGKTVSEQLDAQQAEFYSSYGDLTLDQVTADRLTIDMKNGACALSDLQVSSAFTYNNKYGNVTLQNINAEKAEVVLTLSNGDLSIEALQANRFSYDNKYGKGIFQEVTANSFTSSSKNGNMSFTDCSIGNGTVDSKYGDINATNTDSTSLKLNSKNGNVNWQGSLQGETSIDCAYGSVFLAPTLDKTQYSYELYTSYGDIFLNDQKVSDSSHLSGDSGKNAIHASTKNGDLHLNFAEPVQE